jgi:ubiquinone/menaquinone biosynthesis C-methylase UbiE
MREAEVGKRDNQDRFDRIYSGKALPYHELVVREDVEGNLPAALRDIVDLSGRTVVEMGAGTGRVTKIVAAAAARVLAFDRSPHMLDRAREYLADEVMRCVTLAAADNDAIPLPNGSADAVIEGWSFGHTVTRTEAGWKDRAEVLLAEAARLLRPGGTMIIIETLGTGARIPSPPGTILPRYYAWLEQERGFTARWIRTDYLFESLDKARELVEFFFGSMVPHEIRPDGTVLVPECTGLWWRRKA